MKRSILTLLLLAGLAFAQTPELDHAPAPEPAHAPAVAPKRGGGSSVVPGSEVVEAAASGDAIRFLGALCVALLVGGSSGWGLWFRQLTTIETLRADKAQAILDERAKSAEREAAMRTAHETTCATLRAATETVAGALRSEAQRALEAARQEHARELAGERSKLDALRSTHDQEIRRLYTDQLQLSSRVADAVERLNGLAG